jgi:hypothetical protein
MDAKLQWKISPNVNTLVDAIARCKQELMTAAFSKNGMGTKLLTCDAYAGSQLLELLALSELWTPVCEITEEDLKTSVWRRQKKTTELVADFTVFKLHRMDVLGADAIRIITTFQVPDSSADQVWYGTVEITK